MRMRRPQLVLVLSGTLMAGMLGSPSQSKAVEAVTFKVLVESVTEDDTLALPDGTRTKAPVSPGVYLVARKGDAVFESGARVSGTPFEPLAEDGNPDLLVSAIDKADAAKTLSTIRNSPLLRRPAIVCISRSCSCNRTICSMRLKEGLHCSTRTGDRFPETELLTSCCGMPAPKSAKLLG